jgi:cobalamin biosynthesis protein CobW
MSKIPATIVTGFLGAGKTTLVRHVLANANGKRIALIINEFGDLGIDKDVLAGCGDETCREEDMIELANGCICCTVADDFIPTMKALLDRPDRPDHIIIETSGLALPQPLAQAFNWPEIKAEVTIDAIVTLVDAAALNEGRFAANETDVEAQRADDPMLDHETPLGELFEDQLICADLVVINKADLVSGPELERIGEDLRHHMRPGTGFVQARNGAVDIEALLGLGLATEDKLSGRESHHEREHDGAPHEHDDFDSFSLNMPAEKDKQALIKRIETTIRTHDVLRLKGFAAIEGSAARLAIQAVGPRVNTWFDRPWNAGETQQTSLVVIGESPLAKDHILKSLTTV